MKIVHCYVKFTIFIINLFSDPVTKKFLTNTMDPVFGFPKLVRFSWSTAEKILEEHAVQVDW